MREAMRTWHPILLLVASLLAACAEPDELGLGEPGPRERGRFVIDGEVMELGYQVVNGHRLLEGDIVLDDELELAPGEEGVRSEALYAVTSDARLWPRGVVPYTIDDSVTTPGRVREAMRIWEATGIRFVRRTTQRAYVTFLEDPGHSVCSAQVGYDGTRQYVYLRDTRRYDPCNLGVTVHEIGHVLGLWHEHTRSDRDEHVRIRWDHVPDDHRDAFEIMRARRVGRYDITSTMHYRSFTLYDGVGASIVARDGSLLTHNWETLSRGDVAAIRALYFDGTPVPRDAAPAERDAGAARDTGARDAGTPAAAADAAGAPSEPDAGPTEDERDAGVPDDWAPEGDAGMDRRPATMPTPRGTAGGCSAGGRASGLWAALGMTAIAVLARRRWRR